MGELHLAPSSSKAAAQLEGGSGSSGRGNYEIEFEIRGEGEVVELAKELSKDVVSRAPETVISARCRMKVEKIDKFVALRVIPLGGSRAGN